VRQRPAAGDEADAARAGAGAVAHDVVVQEHDQRVAGGRRRPRGAPVGGQRALAGAGVDARPGQPEQRDDQRGRDAAPPARRHDAAS